MAPPHTYLWIAALDHLREHEAAPDGIISALHAHFDADVPGLPRVNDYVKIFRVRSIPAAGSRSKGKGKNRNRMDDDEGENENTAGRMVMEVSLNILTQAKVHVPPAVGATEGRDITGIILVQETLTALATIVRSVGGSTEQGPPPPSRVERGLRRALG